MADLLATRLEMPCLPPGSPRDLVEPQLVLWIDAGLACLCQTGPKAPGPLVMDFSTPALQRRARQGVSQSLARACGLRSGLRPRILDVTAGLGRDAFVLAALGSEVTMVERHPVLHLLLELALTRLRGQTGAAEGPGRRLDLICGDAAHLMEDGNLEAPEVVYMDPMFPPRRKAALVKKEMQFLKALLGEENTMESEELLRRALDFASERVVVKRPRISDPLIGLSPDHQFVGRSHRYDLYLVPDRASGPDSDD